MPRCREKPLGIDPETVPKPTQVGGYKYTKARERNLVKELGNLAPYLRKKGSPARGRSERAHATV